MTTFLTAAAAVWPWLLVIVAAVVLSAFVERASR